MESRFRHWSRDVIELALMFALFANGEHTMQVVPAALCEATAQALLSGEKVKVLLLDGRTVRVFAVACIPCPCDGDEPVG